MPKCTSDTPLVEAFHSLLEFSENLHRLDKTCQAGLGRRRDIAYNADIHIDGTKTAGDEIMQQRESLPNSESASSSNADSEIYRPLWDAIKKQQVDIIEGLIRNGIDVNIKAFMNATPLYYAALVNADVAVLQSLVSHGADINAKADNGSTPLHEAVMNGDFEAIRFLVSNGADVNAQDEFGVTPLAIAPYARVRKRKRTVIVQYLSRYAQS